MIGLGLEAVATCVLFGKVVSRKLEDWITNQRTPGAWGGGERLEVEEETWTKEAEDAAEAKSMWDRSSKNAWEA